MSPAEPPAYRRLGKSSPVPEKFGADFWWVAHRQKYGVQRKAIADFVASVIDGRLHREVGMMTRLDVAVLAVEGPIRWTPEGVWVGPTRWDRFRHRQYCFDLQILHHIHVVETAGVNDTIELITELERWSRKDKHIGPRARANAAGAWGTPTSREWWCHVAQSWPGIGPELALRLVDHFGGRLPVVWTVGEDDLRRVDGIGPLRAKRMIEGWGTTTRKPAPNGTATNPPTGKGSSATPTTTSTSPAT